MVRVVVICGATHVPHLCHHATNHPCGADYQDHLLTSPFRGHSLAANFSFRVQVVLSQRFLVGLQG